MDEKFILVNLKKFHAQTKEPLEQEKTGLIKKIMSKRAFDALVDSFKLTQGLRLSDMRSCYGAQSGEVFITAIDNQATQQFQLVARQAELDKWQTHLQQLGFDLALANVA